MLYFESSHANPNVDRKDKHWPSMVNSRDVEDARKDITPEFTKALADVGSYMGDKASNPNVKKIGKLIAAMGDEEETGESGEEGTEESGGEDQPKKDPPKKEEKKKGGWNLDPTGKRIGNLKPGAGRLKSHHELEGPLLNESIDYQTGVILERWQKLAGLE